MTTRSVADRVGVSAASVSRNETGSRHPGPEEVSALCALYGLTGERRDRLVERSRDTNGETVRLPEGGQFADQLANIMLLESESLRITTFEFAFVPGLLQTAEYAREIISIYDRPVSEVERRLSTRLGRQGLLSRPSGPETVFLVDEFVLRRPVASATTMRRQIDHLIQMQESAKVTVWVIPGSVGAYAGMEGSFTNYELPATGPYVYIESRVGGLFLTRPEDTSPYLDTAATLSELALSSIDTIDLLTAIQEDFSR